MPTPEQPSTLTPRFPVILGWSLSGGAFGAFVGGIPIAIHHASSSPSPSGSYGMEASILVLLFIICCVFGVLCGAILGKFQSSERLRARCAYDWLVRLVISIGIATFVGGLCFLLFLSVIGGRFGVFFIVVAGSLAVLTSGLIALRSRYWGAGTMTMAALIVVECGIRANLEPDGYIDKYDLYVTLFVSVSMALLAAALLIIGGRYSLRTLLIFVAIASILVVGINQRYVHVRETWNATHHRNR